MLEHNTQQTSIEHLEEAVARLTQSHPFLSQNQTSLVQAQIDMNLKMDSLLERLANLTPIPTSPKFTPTPTPASCSRSHMKLEIPRFDGSDPMGWIFKATQFFEYQNLPDQEKIIVARFYMESPALSWFQWMHHNGFLMTWPTLLQAIESRFAPSFSDNATHFSNCSNVALSPITSRSSND